MAILLPEFISDQAVTLALSNIREVVSVLKGRHKFNRSIRNGKRHVRIFPEGGHPVILPRKISFHGNIQRDVLFTKKVVLCYRCKTRHMFGDNCPVITPTQKNSNMSFTERSATSSRNPSPTQLDHTAEIVPCIESLEQPSAPTKDVVALEKFLIRIRILNEAQDNALILIHIMNLTQGLSILRKNYLPKLRRTLHQRFLKIRPTWEEFSTGAISKCTSEMYQHINKETYHR